MLAKLWVIASIMTMVAETYIVVKNICNKKADEEKIIKVEIVNK